MDHLLPTLHLLAGTTEGLSQSIRHKAVKFAADKSLALTGSGSCWSAALKKKLRLSVEENRADLAASNQVSEKHAILLGSRKIRGNNYPIVDNSVEVNLRKQKSHVNADTRHPEGVNMEAKKDIMEAKKERHLTRYSSCFRRYRRCTVTSPKLARCIYRRTSRRSKNINFGLNSFSSADRSLRLGANAISCKFGSHHKLIFKRVQKKDLKKLVPKVKQVRPLLADEPFLDRVQTLQQLVPGGARMKTDHLLHESIDYIFCLRFQVDMMKSLLAATDARSHV
ncbi:hypothetical protein O6H91_12G071600 [Diphasiastrum complanatum]|nr:hypothetical protein O6H91_12G071600 [Diphasiastrum complanatum]